jgi:hypothetical protein
LFEKVEGCCGLGQRLSCGFATFVAFCLVVEQPFVSVFQGAVQSPFCEAVYSNVPATFGRTMIHPGNVFGHEMKLDENHLISFWAKRLYKAQITSWEEGGTSISIPRIRGYPHQLRRKWGALRHCGKRADESETNNHAQRRL